MNTTDYEKAKTECWKELSNCLEFGEITKAAFDFTFEMAYRLAMFTEEGGSHV